MISWWNVDAGIAPLLTNASVVLWNWRRFNSEDSVNLSNIACLRTTVAGLDEAWFYLVTVEIEAKGAAVCGLMVLSCRAARPTYSSWRALLVLMLPRSRNAYGFLVSFRCNTYGVAQAMAAIEDALHAVVEDDAAALRSALECLMVAIRDINVSMDRMFGMRAARLAHLCGAGGIASGYSIVLR